MSDYSKVNLLEIDNSSDNKNRESHFARKYLESRDLGVSLLSYAPNYQSEVAHSHKVQEEAYVVVKGSGRILLNKEVIDLKLWDVVRVAPEVSRAFGAGPDGLDLIAVGGPKPEGGDGEIQTPSWPKA